MKAIIFGANGQDGFYLSQLLERQNVETIGISRRGNFVNGDVSDFRFVESQIKNHQPDYIFHFAANSTTRHEALFENHEAISTGTFNILESLRLHCPKAKIFLSGSAMQFENQGLPIDENTPFAASSPYSVSRIQSVYAGRYYREKFGLQVYVGYFFNHDSPLRTENHVNQKIAVAAKNEKKIEIGNISVKKEFNYAGDIVEAVWDLISQNIVYEAVIGSGKAFSIENWLELCFGYFNKDWNKFVTINSAFQPEYKILISNPTQIKSIGWQPKTSIEDLAKMMVK